MVHCYIWIKFLVSSRQEKHKQKIKKWCITKIYVDHMSEYTKLVHERVCVCLCVIMCVNIFYMRVCVDAYVIMNICFKSASM